MAMAKQTGRIEKFFWRAESPSWDFADDLLGQLPDLKPGEFELIDSQSFRLVA
jgi:hypothetical protein